ncbi:hypothetical protein ABT373_06040 [Streptomyces sp. NPDC000070]|uniref:hypothetical protein n=1 Tax=Streptomyces sp. NPDC000070 TaxID=3154240 RepID=UPI00333412F4
MSGWRRNAAPRASPSSPPARSAPGSVYTDRLTATVTDRLGADGARLTGGELTPELLRDLPEPVRHAFRTGVVDGLHGVALGTAALCAVAFAVSWLVREVPLRGR